MRRRSLPGRKGSRGTVCFLRSAFFAPLPGREGLGVGRVPHALTVEAKAGLPTPDPSLPGRGDGKGWTVEIAPAGLGAALYLEGKAARATFCFPFDLLCPPPWKGGVGGGSGSACSDRWGSGWPTHPRPLPFRDGGRKGDDRGGVKLNDLKVVPERSASSTVGYRQD